jgi:hypothetical protein
VENFFDLGLHFNYFLSTIRFGIVPALGFALSGACGFDILKRLRGVHCGFVPRETKAIVLTLLDGNTLSKRKPQVFLLAGLAPDDNIKTRGIVPRGTMPRS